LADKVEPKYGDRTLAKFATAIGVASAHGGTLAPRGANCLHMQYCGSWHRTLTAPKSTRI
jgi:hypothetical protein